SFRTNHPERHGRRHGASRAWDMEPRSRAGQELHSEGKHKIRIEGRPFQRSQSHAVQRPVNESEWNRIWANNQHPAGTCDSGSGAYCLLTRAGDKKYTGIVVAQIDGGVFQMEFRDLLTEEHTAIERALEVLRTMVDRVERRVPTDKHDVNALLIFLHYFGDACHQAKEEAILFPILKSAEMSAASVKLELFQEDHSDQRDSIEAAQLALFTDNQDEFVASAR